jgi:hypothetical protein
MMRSNERVNVDGARARTWNTDCPIINASSAGLFLASGSPPPIGQTLTLDLALENAGPISVTARVIWINDSVHPGAQHLPPGFGVRIQRMGLAEKLALIRFLRVQRPATAGPAAKGDDSPGQ